MSYKCLAALRSITGLAKNEISVLRVLADRADDSGYCYPSIDTIGKEAGYKPRRTKDTIKRLEQIGAIKVDRSKKSHSYTLTLEILSVERAQGLHLSDAQIAPIECRGLHLSDAQIAPIECRGLHLSDAQIAPIEADINKNNNDASMTLHAGASKKMTLQESEAVKVENVEVSGLDAPTQSKAKGERSQEQKQEAQERKEQQEQHQQLPHQKQNNGSDAIPNAQAEHSSVQSDKSILEFCASWITREGQRIQAGVFCWNIACRLQALSGCDETSSAERDEMKRLIKECPDYGLTPEAIERRVEDKGRVMHIRELFNPQLIPPF